METRNQLILQNMDLPKKLAFYEIQKKGVLPMFGIDDAI